MAVPRLTTQLGKELPLGKVWGDSALDAGGRWRNVFTGETFESLELAKVFSSFPVAIFERG